MSLDSTFPDNCLPDGILHAQYDLLKTIGRGTYGRALLVSRKVDGKLLVIKQVNLSELEAQEKAAALNEVAVLSQFDHVNIIRYHTCFTERDFLHIVMEHATQGDLGTLIQSHASLNKPLAEADIMNWFVQILLALWHVHGKKVLHRDLKSQNIFMTEGSLVGTPYYLSPEICEDKAYDHKSDVWSLGCILYEMATLKRAFNGQSLPALVLKILRGKYPPLPARYSGSMKGLVDCMLKIKPQVAAPGSVSNGASESADTSLAVPTASAAAVDPSCLPGNRLQPASALDSAPDASLQAASPAAVVAGRHHNVGPESTWAVRQSAELEDLQAALNKQCFRRGRSTPEAAIASSSESVSASRELDDDAEARIAMVPISKVTLSVAVQHNKELEKQQAAIQQERDRRKQHATQKALEVEEMQRAKSIVRRQSMERHKRELAEQDFEKASKAAAAEQARKDREQTRQKEQAEVQQRLAAHKQGVKAAKTRVDRAALQSLGEAFAARLQSNSEASDKPVLFVEASHPSSSDDPQMAPSGPTPRAQASCVSAQPANSPSHAPGAPPGMGLRDWIRQKKKDSAASGSAAFPHVQVFCPGGGADSQQDGHLDQQAGQPDLKSGAAEAFCSSDAAGALGRDGVCSQAVHGQDLNSVASSSDRREGQGPLLHRPQGSGPVLEVLTDIEDALEGELTFRDGLPGSQDGGDKGSQEGSDRGGPTAGRVEQLRMSLEQQLGPSKLLAAHRYLTQVQNAQDDDTNTQAVLEQILGDQMHLAHSINKLLSLESAVYQ
ncbi:TPA: hypothetical protein ACH3X2_010875 [Trebouxia sp. C0005]